MTPDEALYAWKAKRISQDLTFLSTDRAWHQHPPLVPLGVGLLAKVMPLDAAILVATRTQAVLGPVMAYVLGVQLGGPVAGLVTGSLLAADPTYRILSNRLLLDIPLMILFVGSTWLLIRGDTYRIWAVVVGALALFIKDYGVLILLYAVTCIAYDLLLRRGWRPATAVGALLTSSASILALVGYFTGYLLWEGEQWYTFSILPKRTVGTLWTLLNNSVGWVVPTVQKRYLAVLVLLAVPLVVWLLSFSWRREYVFIFLWITFVLVPHLATYSLEGRVVLLFAPAVYLLVGICVAQGIRLARTSRLAYSLFGLAILSSLFVLLMARANPRVLYYNQCQFISHYPVVEWIQQNIPSSDAVVFSRSSHQLRFYATRDYERDGGIFYGRDTFAALPYSVPAFRRVLDATSKDAYLIVDIEEKPDPFWLYPPKRGTLETIEALGFQLVHVVWVPVGAHCQLPATPYYSEIPSFLEHLGLPLHRTAENKLQRVGALVFRKDALGVPRPRA